jgi:hypothetical protein
MTAAMQALDRAQQVRRIARLLGVEPDAVNGLGDVPVSDLRALHDQIAESLFVVHEESFARVAGVSKVIPGAVAGKLAERFLQPALAARAAVLLEPAKAGDLVNKVSVSYLADIAVSLDPVRGQAVIRAIPPARVAEVARELFQRDELAAMAEFAGTVDKLALDAALRVATPSQLVRVAPLLVWNDNIEEIIDELSDARLDDILRAVAEDDLWVEASVLLRRLRPETLARVAGRLSTLPAVRAQIPTDLVGELAVDLFETGELDTMVLFVPIVPDAALARALDLAGGSNLLKIAPLLEWTDPVHRIVDGLTDEQLEKVLHAMSSDDLWTEASVLLHRVHPETLSRAAGRLDAASLLKIAPLLEWNETVLAVVEGLPDSYLDQLLTEVADHGLWSEAEALLDRLDESMCARIVARGRMAPPQLVARFRDQALANITHPVIRDIIAAVDAAS